MTDDNLASTLSSMVETLKQITKELIEAGDRQTKANQKILNRLEGRESNRMGRLSESIVANIIARFMNKYFRINIDSVLREVKVEIKLRNLDEESDIDVLAIGDQAIVVIEVKTTINEGHITDFDSRVVRNFANVKFNDKRNIKIPNLKKKKLYGGVAFIGVAKNVTEDTIITTAEKHGLFAMKIIDKNSVELCNTKKNYKPKQHKT